MRGAFSKWRFALAGDSKGGDAVLKSISKFLACLLVLKIINGTVVSYRDYMPPNFESIFLEGRESYFFREYQWAFYPHIISGPCSLLLGLILVSDRFRQRFPR